MKRIFAIVLALALMATMSVTAFADEDSGNLSITNGGQTYYYDYLADALDDAQDGDVIKVEKDYMEESETPYYENSDTLKSVTLNLNGKEIHTPAGYFFAEDHGMLHIYGLNITFTDTVGGGVIHALVNVDGNTVVKGGTFLGFFPLGEVTIEGGTFLGLPQDIVDDMLEDGWPSTATFIGTKGLLLTTYDRVFLSEDEARAALDALLADGYTTDKPYEITPYETNGETRYSAGFAANTTIVKVDYTDTTVTYNVAPSYTVTIPTDVPIGGSSATVSVADVIVNKGQYVSVSLADDNDFTVTTEQGAELIYTVTANGEAIAAGGEILAVNPSNATDGSAEIAFAIDEDTIQYAGDYTGTATFTVAVKDVPVTTISFTIDGEPYQADAGMTWAQWVESEYSLDNFDLDDYDSSPYVYRGFHSVVGNPGATDAWTEGHYVEKTAKIESGLAYVLLPFGA